MGERLGCGVSRRVARRANLPGHAERAIREWRRVAHDALLPAALIDTVHLAIAARACGAADAVDAGAAAARHVTHAAARGERARRARNGEAKSSLRVALSGEEHSLIGSPLI
jgi:hypothetical protein